MRNYFILLLFFSSFCRAQDTALTIPPEHDAYIKIADSLSATGRYSSAIEYMNKAAEAFKGFKTDEDIIKTARLYSLIGKPDSAFHKIEALALNGYFFDYLKIERDTAFSNLRKINSTRFDALIATLKNNKNKVAPGLNMEWNYYLDSIYTKDQEIRKRWIEIGKIEGPNSEKLKPVFKKVAIIDSLNRIAVTKFIDDHGWQGPEIVGNRGNATLFLVIQHSDSATQEKYIPLLRQAVRDKKARPQSLALMEDRLSVSKNGYQIYGSQLYTDVKTGKYILSPIKDEKNVDQRRKEVGLEPLADYVKRFGLDYTPPN